ncbi:MAG: hypothetical protein ACD_12C00352G0005 [uncultured bacterium]|nr:MAG: hypothetical protein ACD_12C00352G0005 [uncultured bacterium]
MAAAESVAGKYRAEVKSRQSKVELPTLFSSYHFFLNRQDYAETPVKYSDHLKHFKESSLGQRFETEIRPFLHDEFLERRSEALFTAVLTLKEWRDNEAEKRGLGEEEKGLQVSDAEIIQGWVNELIKPDEFPKFVPPAFSGWAERLTEKPIPHIAQANRFIGERITEHFHSLKVDKVKGVDLGAGTGATMLAVEENLNGTEIEVDISGVDLTPVLANKAHERTGKKVDIDNMLNWLSKQKDGSLDFITSVYAMHHLHYKEQLKLQRLAFKKLRKGGIFAIADPTGKSLFNLKNLDINEPEAVIACFRPDVGKVVKSLKEFNINTENDTSGKIEVEIDGTDGAKSEIHGNVLDQGALGYAVVAVKP